LPSIIKKRWDQPQLHAGQPVNADCAACGVTPKLDKLLDAEYACQVIDRSTILGMSAFKLVVSEWVAGGPTDVGDADDVAVQVSFEMNVSPN